nr:MAG TPA: hypothetical protein [Caudoviricetes sp.]
MKENSSFLSKFQIVPLYPALPTLASKPLRVVA